MARKIVSTREVRHVQARYAVRVRDLGRDHADTQAARSEYRSEKYLAAVRAAVAEAPPLTAQQRARLAAILAPVTAPKATEAAA